MKNSQLKDHLRILIKKSFILILMVIAISLLFEKQSVAQNIDSLKLALKNCKHDSIKGQIFNNLGMSYYLFAPDSAYYFWEKSLQLANKNLVNVKPEEKKAFLVNKAEALGSLGYLDHGNGNIELATSRYKESADIFVELNDMTNAATVYNNTGIIYLNDSRLKEAFELFDLAEKYFTEGKEFKGKAMTIQNKALIYKNNGNMKRAIELYNRSLQIRDSIGDSLGLGHSFYELGIIHNLQEDYTKSKEFLQKSLLIRKNIKDMGGVGASLNELGMLYNNEDNDSSLFFFRESIKYRMIGKNISGIGFSYSGIGSYYLKKNQIDSAIFNFKKGLEYRIKSNEKTGISLSYFLLGNAYNTKGDYKKAMENASKAYALGKEGRYMETICKSANLLSTLYKKSGDYKKSLSYFEEYKSASDSLLNNDTKRKTIESQLNFEFDKKITADSIKSSENKKVLTAQIEKEKTQKYALYIGLFMVFVFAAFIFNRFKVIQKQKGIIEQQKLIVEEKHKEITDSINYAERIQRSFLATTALLDENLNHHLSGREIIDKAYFVFFQPKDVVSGDFYWASKLSNGNFALVTADSTGHGVPGAIMSILNISSLEKSIEEKLVEPQEILNHTRLKIIERLKKDGSVDGGKDGMDCSLISFDFKNHKLIYSAANNPVWIIRGAGLSGIGNKVQLFEFAPDKMPVGKHDMDKIPFSQHVINLEKGDLVYSLTDGFPDQFGGKKGKKFLYKQLKELIISIAHLPMQEQKETLKISFNNWKGNLEQVDDVCLIGVRI